MGEVDSNEKDIKPSAKGQITSGRRGVFKVILDEVILKNLQEIKNNFVEEIIIPSTIDWLYEVCSGFVNDMFKTPGVGRGSTPLRGYGSGAKYQSYSKSYRGTRERTRESSPSGVRSYKDISFDSRRDAEKVIADLRGQLIQYDIVTVQDLCDYSDVEATWADASYGWTNLNRAYTLRGRDGRYYLNLPEPKPIEEDYEEENGH